MPKVKVPKKVKKDEPQDNQTGFNIPPEIRAQFEQARQEYEKPVFSSDENETVPKLRYDKLESEYKEMKNTWTDEKKELKLQLSKSKEETKKLQDGAKKKDGEIEGLKEKLKKTNGDLDKAKDEIKKLKAELEERPVETVVKQDDKKIDELERKLKAKDAELNSQKQIAEGLRTTISGLKGDIDALKEKVAKLERENDSLKNPPEEEKASAGTVEWVSPTMLRSELFTEKKYSVKLARSGEYITFTPDVEGKVACKDNTMEIPSLPKYLVFEKKRFEAFIHDRCIRILL